MDTEEAHVATLLVTAVHVRDVQLTHEDVGVCPGQEEEAAHPDRGAEDVGGGGEGEADVLDREGEEEALQIRRGEAGLCVLRGIMLTQARLEKVVREVQYLLGTVDIM